MARRLPPLNPLRAFECAARLQSFTLAAREMNVSQGAISRHVALLEQHFGIRLFERRHREVALTREAFDYAAELRAAFDLIEAASLRFRGGGARRSLRLVLFPTLAIRWLIPRLGSFHDRHPEIDVQITTSTSGLRFDRDEEGDMTVRFAEPSLRNVRYDPLIPVKLTPVCSPSILQGPLPLRTPADLLRHELLHSLNRLGDWPLWLDRAGVTTDTAERGLKFGNSALAYQAAANGVGIAMAQVEFVADDLASGRLVAPFPLRVATNEVYCLASRVSEASLPNIRRFREWLLGELQSSAADAPIERGA